MNDFTPEQLQCALSEIGNKARTARTVCIEAVASGDPNNLGTMADLVVAARTIIEQIGWIADHHCEPLHREVGDAADWMLPPVYHQQPRVN